MEFPGDHLERAFRFVSDQGDLSEILVQFFLHGVCVRFGLRRNNVFFHDIARDRVRMDMSRKTSRHHARFPLADVGCVTFAFDRSGVTKDLEGFVTKFLEHPLLTWYYRHLVAAPLTLVASAAMPLGTYQGVMERIAMGESPASDLELVKEDHCVVSVSITSRERARDVYEIVDEMTDDACKVQPTVASVDVLVRGEAAVSKTLRAMRERAVPVRVGVAKGEVYNKGVFGRRRPTLVIEGVSFERARELARAAPNGCALSDFPLWGDDIEHQGKYYVSLFELDRIAQKIVPYLKFTARFSKEPLPVVESYLRDVRPTATDARSVQFCHDLWMHGEGKISNEDYEDCVTGLLERKGTFKNEDLATLCRDCWFMMPVAKHVTTSKAIYHERLCFDVGSSRSMAVVQLEQIAKHVLPALVRMHTIVRNAYTRELVALLHAVRRFWQCHL